MRTVLIVLCVLGASALVRGQTPTVRVGHAAASGGILELEGVAGSASGPIRLRVEIENPAGTVGIVGWSVGVAHDPSVLELVSASVAGTAGDVPGASSVEIVPGGVVSLVSLEGDPARTLQPGTTSQVLEIEYRGVFPPKDTTVQTRVRVVDGLPAGGVTVDTRVRVADPSAPVTVTPRMQELRVLLTGFEYSDLFELSLRTRGSDASGQVAQRVAPGGTASWNVESVLTSKLPLDETAGAQGWSLAMVHDGAVFRASSPTTAGTTAGASIRGGFERHELVDNETGQGVISAVVLSFTEPISLPPRGDATLLRVAYGLVADTATDGARIEGAIAYRDRLRGQGQPVNNVITHRGASQRPRVQAGLSFRIDVGVAVGQAFIRSDANGDSRVDIGDGVWLVKELFLAGPRGRCFYAGDSNGDGRKDLSDAAYILGHQFLGGPPPPPPFPGCGTVDGQDEALCPAGSTPCS